jgi:hypothetical protein
MRPLPANAPLQAQGCGPPPTVGNRTQSRSRGNAPSQARDCHGSRPPPVSGVLDFVEPTFALGRIGLVPVIRWSGLRVLPLMVSFTPLRYPRPYPTTKAATTQPAMNSQVRPLGRVHTMCTVAPRGRSHQFG